MNRERSLSQNPAQAGRVRDEPAFVLHATPWRETSLIVDLLTRSYGRIGVVARGAKRPRSALRAVLLAFQPLTVSWSGRAELRTLVAADWVGGLPAPQGSALLSSFYLNELIVRLLPREDPHPELFDAYLEAVGALGHGLAIEPSLRRFERSLLEKIGYGTDLQRDAQGQAIDPCAYYEFDPARGWVRLDSSVYASDSATPYPMPSAPLHPGAGSAESASNGAAGGASIGATGAASGSASTGATGAALGGGFSGAALRALAQGQFSDLQTLAQVKSLTRMMLNARLEGRPLATRQILLDLQRF